MSLGAMTSNVAAAARGPVFIDDVTIVGDSSYPTGGSAGLLAALRLLRKDNRTILDVKSNATNGGYHVTYVPSTDLLVVRVGATGVDTEVANATNLSGTNFGFLITSY